MIRVVEEGAELGEPMDDVPELPADLIVTQLLRRRQGDSRLRQEVEQGALLPLLVRGDVLQEQVVKIFRVVCGHRASFSFPVPPPPHRFSPRSQTIPERNEPREAPGLPRGVSTGWVGG